MKKYQDVENIIFEGNFLVVTIDGDRKQIQLNEISSVLEKALENERSTFEISPSGYGVQRPLLDEDISIDGLLGIIHSPSEKRKTA